MGILYVAFTLNAKGSFTLSVSVNVNANVAMTLEILFPLKTRVVPVQGCNPFGVNLVFNDSIITSIIAALTLTLSTNGPYDQGYFETGS